jgi:acyl-coenzyme A synthetase/AMP-(fatty) acid ligase
VSITLADPLRTLFAFFGLQKCGAVYSPVDTELNGAALSWHIRDTAP